MKPSKIPIGILLTLLSITVSRAQQVTAETAKSVATRFMNSIYTDKVRTIKSFNREGLQPMLPVMSDEATINVVTFQQGGWVILSNDKSAPPILAYCDDGDFSLDTNDMPGGLIELLQDYREGVADIRRNYSAKGSPADYTVNQQQWYSIENSKGNSNKPFRVDNLLKTPDGKSILWDQEGFSSSGAQRAYNKYMPPGSGKDCFFGKKPAGCGTVAMAQIMRYWEFPPQYDWDNMPSGIYSTTAIDDADRIARLYFDCGKANSMNYFSCKFSFTFTSNLERGMQQFRYLESNKRRRGDKDDGQWWPDLIKANLNAGRPLIYRGDKCDFCGDKHFWNISGYDAENRFYCNWGWSGSWNGWYRLDDFRIIYNDTVISDYRKNNMIIRDIYPDWNVQDDAIFENISKGQDEELRAFNRNITLKNVTLTDNARAKLCFTQTLTIEGPLTIGPNTSFILQSCAKEAVAAQAMQTAAYRDGDDDMDALSEEYEEPMAGLMEVAQPETDEAFSFPEPNNTWGLWPNPNQGAFEIWVAAPDLIPYPKTLSVYNANGNLVYETDFEGERCSVNGIQGKGLHVVVLKTPEQVYAQKILIR